MASKSITYRNPDKKGSTLKEAAKERIKSLDGPMRGMGIFVLGVAATLAPITIPKNAYPAQLRQNDHKMHVELKMPKGYNEKLDAFKLRKYDIQESLQASNPKYSEREISCIVKVPSTSKEFGQAFLLNGLTDRGYWYQIGIAQGISLGSENDTKFGIAYMAADPQGRILYITTQNINSLEPNSKYRINMSVSGNKVIAKVSDSGGSPIRIIEGPAFGSTDFVGGRYMLHKGWTVFTGAMTEIISAKMYNKTGRATYLLDGTPSNKEEYFIESGITKSVMGTGKAYSDYSYNVKSSRTYTINSQELVMGNYVGILKVIKTSNDGKERLHYSFSTFSK